MAIVAGLAALLPGSPLRLEPIGDPEPTRPHPAPTGPSPSPDPATQDPTPGASEDPAGAAAAEPEALPGWAVIGQLDSPRLLAHMFAADGRLIVFGGVSGSFPGRGDSRGDPGFTDRWDGVLLDPDTGTTRQFSPAPPSDALRGAEDASPATAHCIGDGIAVLAGSRLLHWDADTDRWTERDAPPISGRGRVSIWTGTELLAVTGDMEAATWDPGTDTWTTREPLPLRSSECLPLLADGPAFTLARLCSGIAIWDGSGDWALMPLPTARAPYGRPLVATDDAALSLGEHVLRYQLPPIEAGRLVRRPRAFPLNTHQLELPQGWDVVRTIGARRRPRSVPAQGQDEQGCQARATPGRSCRAGGSATRDDDPGSHCTGAPAVQGP